MAVTLRDTIKDTVAKHLNGGGLAFGQCLTAVGWVGGTLPEMYEDQGMVELSMADVAGGAIVTGAGLTGRRPIYVIRYQGFNWYNCVSILNYACKSKEMWGVPCPVFVRSIAMEGAIGPVAGGSHHSLYHRMPGIKIYSPMTPNEYKECYNDFMNGDDVFYVSEHREAYNNTEELEDIEFEYPDFILFPISICRFAAVEASRELLKEGLQVSVYHQRILKPFKVQPKWSQYLQDCQNGLVIDDDFPDGIASTLAQKLMLESGAKVWTMGLEERSAGFAKHLDNLPPSKDKIKEFIKNAINN
jgi:acetoin:2,6-dichlorophenolindophenol oxidoreductase subunit beta